MVEKEVGYIPGIKIARGFDLINHALFANDSLLLGGASLKITRAFNEIIQKFCLITNCLGFPGFDKWEKIKYLGFPLTLGSSPPSLWLEVLAKIKARIASWGGQWLTKAGKLILIKAVLSSLPIF